MSKRIVLMYGLMALVVCLPWMVAKLRSGRVSLARCCAVYGLTYSFMMLFYVTMLWGGTDYFYGLPDQRNLNFSPFIWMRSAVDAEYITSLEQFFLNIVMFIPFGFLLPAVYSRLRTFSRTALLSLFMTLAIETIQYFIGRTADIDDVIANFAGGILGYILFASVCAVFEKTSLLKHFLAIESPQEHSRAVELYKA